MDIKPLYLGGSLETVERKIAEETVTEISEAGLLRLLGEGKELQKEMCDLPLEERLEVVGMLGEVWRERLVAGELAETRKRLATSTGYPEKLMHLEFSLVPRVLNADEIRRNLESSLIGGAAGLESFVELEKGEAVRHLPVGPTFIISSGNSIVPTLIPTIVSLVTGNFTLLKPSLANYEAVAEVFAGLGELMSKSPAAHLMARSLAIGYFGHDSPGLKKALTDSPFGVINFWGGEPARTSVAAMVAENPAHPRFFVNGPLTGVAMIHEARADESAAHGLALNMVLYEQQLCSSPTMAVFVGPKHRALQFAEMVSKHLDSIGSQFPLDPPTEALFVLNSARKVLQFKGSKVLQSQDNRNPWTLAVSKERSLLDEAVRSFPSFGVHGRRRFVEMVVVDDVEKAAALVRSVGSMLSYKGVDKVQTVGLALPEGQREELLWSLASSGVYRLVPLEDMFMRSAAEPYDGVALASLFTFAVYERERIMPTEGLF